MLKTERKPQNESEQMILNNYRTIRWLREHKSDSLTFDMLYEIHSRITQDTLEDPSAVGRFRLASEPINVIDVRDNEIMHVPPPAGELEERMTKLCHFADGGESSGPFMHPAIRAILLHFWLAYDHPFVDGNGRTARALFYWSMLREGYWLFEFLSISRIIVGAPSKYVRAFLDTELDEADVTYFIMFHLRAIQRARKELHEYLDEQRKRNREMLAVLAKHPGLNHRQKALLAHGVKHADATYTIESHRGSHGVVFETARTDLADLARRGLLIEYKVGKRLQYAVPPDIRARLGLDRP
jgi:Fic family protein